MCKKIFSWKNIISTSTPLLCFRLSRPVHEGGRHMKAASVQSPVRQCTSLEKERRVGKPPTPQECNDVGEAARRQQEWTGQVETLQTEKEEEGVRVGLKHHQSTSAALHQSHDAASRQSCSVVLFHWATATPRHRVTSGTVDPPPCSS